MSHLTRDPITLGALIQPASHGCGAALLFTGTVREHNQGRPVNGMAYTAHEALADKELALICQQANEQFSIESCQIIHRLGELQLGEISVAIGFPSLLPLLITGTLVLLPVAIRR